MATSSAITSIFPSSSGRSCRSISSFAALPPSSGDANHRRLFLILCGIAQGLAFLSKTYPALITTILALVAVRSLTRKGIFTLLVSTIVTIAPWLIWTAVRFPHEFARENLQILHHLNENVENWAAPPGTSWSSIIGSASSMSSIPPSSPPPRFSSSAHARKNGWPRGLILARAAAVSVPHLLATSKPMTATLIGWPAAWLMFGNLISRAVRGDRLALGTWLASMLLAIVLLHHDSIPTGGENWGRIPTGFAVIMRQHVVGSLARPGGTGRGAILGTLEISPKIRRFAAGLAGRCRHLPGRGLVEGRSPARLFQGRRRSHSDQR